MIYKVYAPNLLIGATLAIPYWNIAEHALSTIERSDKIRLLHKPISNNFRLGLLFMSSQSAATKNWIADTPDF